MSKLTIGGVVAALVLSVISLVLIFTQSQESAKIGFVHNDVLISKYEGALELHAALKKKKETWQMNLDTLSTHFNEMAKTYQKNKTQFSEEEDQKIQWQLQREELRVIKYKESIEKLATEEEAKMNQLLAEQLNAHSEKFSQEKGYDIVFGVTTIGNMLYGSKDIDVTEQLVNYMNLQYKK